MQIPRNLPQFETNPALFITSGEYEAKFYLAFYGALNLKEDVKMPPREEAREKQGFITYAPKPGGTGAVGHHGAYVQDLKRKFARKVHSVIHGLLAEFKPQEIYLFTPRFVAERLIEKLDKAERKKIKMIIGKEYTKVSPLVMLRVFQKEERASVFPKEKPKKEAVKILAKQKRKG
jgi:hypothetical protein